MGAAYCPPLVSIRRLFRVVGGPFLREPLMALMCRDRTIGANL